MSYKISKLDLSISDVLKIKNDLYIEAVESDYGPPESLDCWGETKKSFYLPFYYSRSRWGKINDRELERTNYKMLFGFKTPKQKEAFDESFEVIKTQKSVLLSGHTGFGKCLGKNTEILMFDGTIKKVQDIQVGDLLMGDDSLPRKVLNTTSGIDQLYEIKPVKGKSYIVNSAHILSLKVTGNKKIYECKDKYKIRYFDHNQLKIRNKEFNKKTYGTKAYEEAYKFLENIESEDIVDISIKDCLKNHGNKPHALKGYKAPVTFPEKNVSLDPYILGCWLGDGTSSAPNITNIDKEIINYLKDEVYKYDCQLKQYKSIITYGIVGNKHGENKFKNLLRKYNVLNNKHIPYDYKCNSRDIQLKILAGIIDTDGYLEEHKKNSYDIIQKSLKLANDISFICSSLGFMAVVKECQKTCTNAKNCPKTGTYYRINIYGQGLEDIPVLIPRKKAVSRKINKDALVTGINIKKLEVGEYYGFEVDGNHRYLLGDFTVTHNSYCGIRLAYKTKYKTAVLIHRAVLAEQWAESIEKFTTATVQIVDTKTKMHPDADFYIFNIAYIPKFWNKLQQSWERKKPSQPDYKTIGTLIVDEAHIACASEMAKALQYFEPKYAIALTATPKRKDGLDKLLDIYFGEKRVIRISDDPFTVFRVNTGIKPVYGTNAFGKKKWGDVVQYLADSPKRNKLIVNLVRNNLSKTIMIMCKLTKHCDELSKLIKADGITVTVMKGTDKVYDKTAKVLISTFSKLGVGFDDSRLDMLILASSVKEVEQYAGRLRYSPGKERIIYDLVDDDYSCQKHWIERKNWYESRNGTIKYMKSDIKEDKPKRFAPVKKG